MDLAALILSLIAILMSGTVLVIFLAKNVFSSHSIQMVPVDSLSPGKSRPMGQEFMEFDAPSAMDAALDQAMPKVKA